MKWSRVFAELGKAAGIVVLVPSVLMIHLRWDSVLPIIIYFQLLLIWIQAEVSLRQNELYAAQFEPFFDVQVTGAARMAGFGDAETEHEKLAMDPWRAPEKILTGHSCDQMADLTGYSGASTSPATTCSISPNR